MRVKKKLLGKYLPEEIPLLILQFIRDTYIPNYHKNGTVKIELDDNVERIIGKYFISLYGEKLVRQAIKHAKTTK